MVLLGWNKIRVNAIRESSAGGHGKVILMIYAQPNVEQLTLILQVSLDFEWLWSGNFILFPRSAWEHTTSRSASI
jgi:hypothetical protein